VALWFAVEQRQQNDGRNSYFYVFEVDDDDLEQNPDLLFTSSIDTSGSVKAFRPFHIDRRIAAQAGWFTIHPYEEERNSYSILSEHSIRGKLSSHWLNNNNVHGIREELLRMGISRATLFPDLDGISQAIEMDLRLKRIHIASLEDDPTSEET
jgi:hypothetical protein